MPGKKHEKSPSSLKVISPLRGLCRDSGASNAPTERSNRPIYVSLKGLFPLPQLALHHRYGLAGLSTLQDYYHGNYIAF